MAGSIRKRPDKGADAFELRVFLGRDANGRVQHRSRLFHGTQRAAERALARLITTQEATPAIVPNEASRAWGPTTTINNAITGWKANGWDDLSPSTTRRYDSIWTTHIKNSIGRRKIALAESLRRRGLLSLAEERWTVRGERSTSSCHVASGLSARAQVER